MKEGQGTLLTAANIAKQLGVSDAKVKKALKDLAIAPVARKGVCNYYAPEVVRKVKAAAR